MILILPSIIEKKMNQVSMELIDGYQQSQECKSLSPILHCGRPGISDDAKVERHTNSSLQVTYRLGYFIQSIHSLS